MYQCAKNISLCAEFYNSTLCSSVNNNCVKDHGYCVFNETIKPKCLCLPCFTGDQCEQEKVSRNLWSSFVSYDEITQNGYQIFQIMTVVYDVLLVFNGVLCLQTYLCRNIRVTNLGIYLIMLSIVSIVIDLSHLIVNSMYLHFEELPQSYIFDVVVCLYATYIHPSLVYMYNWFIASVAIERMLIECFRNYGLHDSRRRSVISSAIIVIICPLTTLLGAFTVRKNQSLGIPFARCKNFTPLGYILYQTAKLIHLLAFYFLYIVMNALVLRHLVKHRQRCVDSNSLSAHICLILKKHKDFFIPYLVEALSQLPSVLMDFMMTCSTAGTVLVARIHLAFAILAILPFAMAFYLYIYLSPVYWSEFLNSSPIGKCLMKMK